MLGLNAGSAYVAIKPDLRGVHTSIRSQLATTNGTFARAGVTAGDNYSRSFGKRFLGGLGTIAKRGGIALGAGIALGGAAIVKSSIALEQEFGSVMSQLAATTEAPKREMRALNGLAMKMGADTVFSANEAANAMLELAKGGMKPATIQAGGLKGTLSLAAAGGTDLSTAAMIASDALNVFNLRGGDMEKVAAALAGGANASSASVESLGLAMSQAGLSAKSAGLSVQETVATLAAFDNAGLKGSDAGTSLKTMLSRLVPQTDKAQTKMRELGLDFTKADGSIVSITNVADQLQRKLGPLSDAERETALNTIFGSDARRAAIALMDEGGKGLDKYIAKTSDLGAAQRMADSRMRGTAGAIEKMKGSLETAGLAIGVALRPVTIAISNMVAEIANKALPYIRKFGAWLRERMKGGNVFEDVSNWVGRMLPKLRQIGPDAKKAFGEIGPALKDAKSELPTFTDGLKVGGIVLGFLADHAGTVAKLLPWLAAGFALAKTAQLAANAAATVAIPLRIAEMFANRRLAASNTQLIAAIRAQTGATKSAIATEKVSTGTKNAGIVASTRARLATIAKSIAERASAAATKAMALAQRLLNAAMRANPIGLIITALMLLVGAVVLLWKKNEGFRKAVTKVWNAIKQAIVTVWQRWVKPVFEAIADWVTGTLMPVLQRFWNQTVKPVFKRVGDLIKSVWEKYVKPAFNAIASVLVETVFPIIKKLFVGYVKVYFALIKTAIKVAWTAIKAVFMAIKWVLTNVVFPVIRWLWDKVIKPVFSRVVDGIKRSWNDYIKPVFQALGGFIKDTVAPAFRKGVEAIGRAWDWLKSAATKPVNFVIDTVYNKGIRGFINGILDKFPGDAPKLPYISPIGQRNSGGSSGRTAPGITMARGGVLPGHTPGRDVHRFVSPTGGRLDLSGGEAVMRPEWTRLVGGPKVVDKLNRAAMRGRLQFARGGVVWPVPGHDTSTYPGHDGVDINRGSGWDDYGDLIRAFRSGRISYVGSGRGYGDAIFERGPYGEVVYGHTSRQLVRAGQYVRAGQPIGAVGNTGNSSAPHLHFGYPGGTTGQALALLNGAISMQGGSAGGGGFVGWLVSRATGWLADKAKALLGKVPGASTPIGGIAVGAGRKVVDNIRNWIVEHFGGATGGGFAGKAVGAAQRYAKSMLGRYGWGPGQFGPLQALWNRESGWRWNADNPTSSAYGIPQALPGSKMATAGADWRTNPATQIRWGLGYIRSRYGSPAAAWAHSQNVGWYDRGGMLPHGGVAVNQSGKPEPVFTDRQWRVLKQAITRGTLGGGTRISAEWLSEVLSRTPKTAGDLRREFVRTRDAMRGFRTRTLRARRALDELGESTRYQQARGALRRADKRLEDARKLGAVRRDLAREHDALADAENEKDRKAARERIEALRRERRRIRELHKARREAADATVLKRYERAQDRLNKAVEAEKRARERAKRAAEAYKAAQESAVERARGIYETGTGLGTLESAPSKTSAGIVANLRRSVATVHEWRGIVGRLIRAGLRGPILDEFVAAGPSVDAVRLGKSLLAGGQIRAIVRLQDELRRESVAAGARGARYYKPKPVAGARRASMLPRDAVGASNAGRTYQIVYEGMPADTVETIVHKTTQRVRYEIAREATL